MSRDLQT